MLTRAALCVCLLAGVLPAHWRASLHAQILPRYTAARELTVDGNRENLSPIGSFVVDANGLMYIGQPENRRILVFSPDGKRLRSIGRAGRDPGQFDQLGNVGLMEDSVWATDAKRSLVHWYTLDGKYKRSVYFSPVRSGPNINSIPIIRVLRNDGSALAAITAPGVMYQVNINRDGEILHALFGERLPNNSFTFSSYDGGKWRPGGSPNPAIINVSPDGNRIAVAVANLTGPRAGIGEVTSMTFAGETLFTREYPVALKPIPKAVVDSGLREIAKTNAAYAMQVRNETIADIYPPLEYLRINRDGGVLLAFYSDGPERDFLIINPKGLVEARLSLPSNVIIRTFNDSHLWGFVRDARGQESIVRMRLQK